MNLFTFKDFKVNIEPEVLLLEPFKEVYLHNNQDADKTMLDFAFIYFYCDTRSDYQFHVDKKERELAIKEGLGLPKGWKINKVLQKAIDYYESFKTESALLLEDTKATIQKVRAYLKEIDLHAVDDKGKPLYPLNTITSTIKMIPSLAKDLRETEKIINSEELAGNKARGMNGDKTICDDGIPNI